MKIIPQAKETKKLYGVCDVSKLCWAFDDGVDERLVRAAKRISDTADGVKAYVNHKNSDSEGYTLKITENEIVITGDSAAGAFYAMQTLKMLINAGSGAIECCEITDLPDMAYRGFYQDTTRGRIPTLDTLKKLADTMADYKMNSLQLYVEHTYEFKEYDFCRDELGYLTKAELQELDSYCKDRFIELIPSLSCFGHLYHLLQSNKYKHLCELKNYEPKENHYIERMCHHTINPLLDESFKVITSLIDQHMEAFTSDKFNICCDETFDLGSDVNKDKDKSELYVGFVKKLIEYLEAKGKTVMMWGDIILKYPEKISELSDSVIFLNWDYGAEPIEEKVEAFSDCTQIICPGTTSWEGMHERVSIEESNIIKLTQYGKKYGAIGILNTNWGDLGNPASISMAMYGLILGAAAGWDAATTVTDELKQFISDYHYGCSEALDILTELDTISGFTSWIAYQGARVTADFSAGTFKNAMDVCIAVIDRINNVEFADNELKKQFLIAAQGDSFIIEWFSVKNGYTVKSPVDFGKWLADYREYWLRDSKQSELDTLTQMFVDMNNGIITGRMKEK